MLAQILYRIGWFATRRRWAVIGTWLALTVVVVGAAAASGAKLEDGFTAPGLDSQRANELVAASGGGQAGITAQVVVTPAGDGTFRDDEAARAALARLQADVRALPHVLGTTDPVGALTGAQDAAAVGALSPDGRVAQLRVQYPGLDQLSAADLTALEAVPHDPALRVEMGGDLFFAYSSADSNVGELVGIVAALVVLLLAFGSFVAATLPVGMAVLGLGVGIGGMTLLAGVMTVPSFAPVLGAMVGLGVGIDYALFVVTRHREHLAEGMAVDESVARSLAGAGRPVVFAGGIVVVSILGLAVAGVPFMTAGGIAISLVVLVMVVASVTLLPALLAVAGQRVVGRHRLETTSPRWERWTRHVTRHPAAYGVGVTVVLLALAAPVVALRVGIPDDGALPPSRTERQAYDLVAEGFGPGRNGPLVVVVDLAGDTHAADAVARAVAADPGVAAVEPPVRRGGLATIVTHATTGPQDVATARTIDRLRTEVFPAALAGTPAAAHVGGQTASFADVGQRVNDRLPLLVGAVLAMSFVLLMLVFRSVLVPLKAVLLNLLSIGAAYGVMVMVFQWGWAADLIGLESTVPIVSFIPMFMFALLFGLSMDYEVFLLSRVRDAYTGTGSNDEAVVRGTARTGRVITSAAAIMICVFLAFVLGEDAATKMFGIGLATAILLDATLVRLVLVPATMKLLGDANWWLPGWLDRLLPHVDVTEPA
ncbi:MMPL family transporter [Cellulomonas gelida]|uniref:Membrane protein n=1 Tax=Cellulomonas gelida TaxID=1712 RepID=A0A4Y3KH97_9CELL|nr:MMPL family transporter [Cellulomonas gelida]GEA83801.1 membrane protein [Cellulomonas gelida]GGL32221.1 membrane protein [Cellulomonas gelida]